MFKIGTIVGWAPTKKIWHYSVLTRVIKDDTVLNCIMPPPVARIHLSRENTKTTQYEKGKNQFKGTEHKINV